MQTSTTPHTILALRPGSRHIGIAIFEGAELLFWGVTSFRGLAPHAITAAVEHRLRSLIEIYEPYIIAVENPSNTRMKASPLLRDIVVRISATTLDSLLYYQLYGLPTIKARLCGTMQATRREMIERIVRDYPHLARYTSGVSKWQESYWCPMFAAVAVGMICIKK